MLDRPDEIIARAGGESLQAMALSKKTPMESFFATFKTELVYQQHFATREYARRAIFDYIEVFYNRQRRHASIGNVAPAEFERRYHAAQLAA